MYDACKHGLNSSSNMSTFTTRKRKDHVVVELDKTNKYVSSVKYQKWPTYILRDSLLNSLGFRRSSIIQFNSNAFWVKTAVHDIAALKAKQMNTRMYGNRNSYTKKYQLSHTLTLQNHCQLVFVCFYLLIIGIWVTR